MASNVREQKKKNAPRSIISFCNKQAGPVGTRVAGVGGSEPLRSALLRYRAMSPVKRTIAPLPKFTHAGTPTLGQLRVPQSPRAQPRILIGRARQCTAKYKMRQPNNRNAQGQTCRAERPVHDMVGKDKLKRRRTASSTRWEPRGKRTRFNTASPAPGGDKCALLQAITNQ